MSDSGEPMVTSTVITRELGIPAYALHRLVKRGVVPVHDVTPKGWPHQRRVLRFKLSEVRAALGEPPAPPRPRAGGHDAAPSNSPNGA